MVITDLDLTDFSLIFAPLFIHQRHLALTRVYANSLVLFFLFIPRRCTSSKGFPEETPAQVQHRRLRFAKSAVKTQFMSSLVGKLFNPQNPRISEVKVFCL
jgi:hypothetical protein